MGAMVRIEKARLLFLSGMTFWKIIGLFSDLIPPPPPPPPLPPPLPTTLESLEELSPLSIAANLVTFGVEEEEETLASIPVAPILVVADYLILFFWTTQVKLVVKMTGVWCFIRILTKKSSHCSVVNRRRHYLPMSKTEKNV